MIENKYEILLVDDSKLLLDTISNLILHDLDVIIHKAEEAISAMRLLGNHDIDIILLDINMPGMDGFKAAKIIKKQKRTSNIPIIFMTGSDPYEELMEKGFEIGAIDYITKPFKDIELIRLLRLYFRFIEHEREANSKLYKLNEELKLEIVQRKQTELALKESEIQLKETIGMKDKFFSIIAHDLKNPLGSYKELTKIMFEEYDTLSPEDFKDFLNDLNNSSHHLYALLENLLVWSRSQLGKVQYQPENFDLRMVVNQNTELMKLNADKKQINLINEIPENKYVFADVNMVTTIIRNLISNAIKFTGENGLITISTEEESNNENILIISVNDNGIGMSEDAINNLFRIDIQHTTLGTKEEKGTGLGLLLCKEFVEKNGGRIWVESTISAGSSFKFTLNKPEELIIF